MKISLEIVKNQAVALRCSVMVKDVLENFAKFTYLCRESCFLQKWRIERLKYYWKETSTGDFLLWNSREHLFYRKPPGDCFWKWPRRIFSDCNWTRARNHLVRKRILNHLVSWNIQLVRIFSVFGKIFAKCIFFNQTQAIF